MAHFVLGIGYLESEYEAVRHEWLRRNVDFHFAHSAEEAEQKLHEVPYICVTVCTNRIDNFELLSLRNIQPIPIVLLSPESDISKRAEYIQQGLSKFILKANKWKEALFNGKDAVQYYLDLPRKGDHPLTVMTTDDIFFCLEYRTVEVRGQTVKLTPKEFDILALLIAHPKQVFTAEMILDLVWKENETYYSRKTLANHISKLRNKLKVHPDVPDHIVSVRGVGYIFDAV